MTPREPQDRMRELNDWLSPLQSDQCFVVSFEMDLVYV